MLLQDLENFDVTRGKYESVLVEGIYTKVPILPSMLTHARNNKSKNTYKGRENKNYSSVIAVISSELTMLNRYLLILERE